MQTENDPVDIPFQRRKCPEQKANFLSRIFLGWVFPLVLQGWRNPLKDKDLWELPDRERGCNATIELEDAINVVLKKNTADEKSQSLHRNYKRYQSSFT